MRPVLPHRVHSFAMKNDADSVYSPRSVPSCRRLYGVQPLLQSSQRKVLLRADS